MYKHILMQTSILCLMAIMMLSQIAYAEEPDTLRTKTIGEDTSLIDEQFWYIVLRFGYPIVSENSFHPVSSGSFAVSGGLYVKPWDFLSLGVDFGYQRWQNESEPDPDSYGYRSHPYSLWNLAAGASVHASSLVRHRQIDPFVLFTLGLYGRSLGNGESYVQTGPGLSYGIGIHYMPDRLRSETGSRIGLGLVIRRHTMLLDDYGAWFVGPSHYWTRTVEAAAELVVSW